MFADDEKDKVLIGSRLTAIGVSDIRALTEGKVYESLYGWEKGIFASRPYVSVIGDDGRQYSCHLSRFKLLLTP